jgi:hypothetical protein
VKGAGLSVKNIIVGSECPENAPRNALYAVKPDSLNIIAGSAYPENALRDALYAARPEELNTHIRRIRIQVISFALFADYTRKMKIEKCLWC